MTKQVFVVGLDDFNLDLLQALPEAEEIEFHALYSAERVRGGPSYPVRQLLHDARDRLRRFSGKVDAVVGYWDFPVSTSLPVIRREAGLPGPSLETVLKCEHKYWSRLEQKAAAPECVPRFQALDPFDSHPSRHLTIDYPFWIKPVKAVLSNLGFRVADETELDMALERIRAGIGRFGKPFNQLLDLARLPSDVADVDGYHCLVEEMISAGHQCTVEGFVRDGRVVCYGIVDSLREGPAGSSFSRYQYPSQLPERVQEQMRQLSERVMTRVGYTEAPFNIEYYWNPETDAIHLLEINPRLSKSHAPLFQLVDGVPHFRVMLATALGSDAAMPRGEGPYPLAAKFMLRRYRDARVERVPEPADIRAVEQAVPGARIQIHPRVGQRLTDLRNQDSYSFEVGTVFIGGADASDLEFKYQRCVDRLPLAFAEEGQDG